MITKRYFVVHYYIQILFTSDSQYAQIFFYFVRALQMFILVVFLGVSSRSTHHQELRK
jgi:hypothetical protein